MPGRNGTGPEGKGAMTGRGLGLCGARGLRGNPAVTPDGAAATNVPNVDPVAGVGSGGSGAGAGRGAGAFGPGRGRRGGMGGGRGRGRA